MSRKEYMRRLEKSLQRLPRDEYIDAVEYYEQYFDEAKDDQKAMTRLGSPESVAAKILADYIGDKSKKNLGLKIWLVVLAIFAAPIALPIAMTFLAVLVTIIACLGAVAVCGLVTIVAGIFAAVASLVFILTNPISTLFFVGVGLVCLSVGILIWNGCVWLIKTCVVGLLKLWSKILRKRV